MPPEDRHVEVSLGFSFDDAGLTDAERAMADFQRKAQQMSGTGGSFDPFAPFAGQTGVGSPATASPPSVPGGGFPASVNPVGNELIDAIRDLVGEMRGGKREQQRSNDLMSWIKANAFLQLGGQMMGQVQQGNLFTAAGTGIGGVLGLLLGGPAGMATGASVGGGIGGFFQGLATGAGDARDYEIFITDLNQRMGVGSVDRLRNYRQGQEFGYTTEESAELTERLRANRALTSFDQASGLVSAVQELTRVLGLNAEQTAQLVGTYTQTGGARGAGAAQEYLASIVGGAVEAGMETSIDRYAEVMGSARMRQAQQTGAGVSDRAFGLLQDVFANLTTGGSEASNLFNANTQLAGSALQTILGLGGTADPFGRSAAFMRLAGIREEDIDLRFNDTEQLMANAGRSIGFLGDRLQGVSGLSDSEFQARAAQDPNFVRGLIGGNAGLQRFTSNLVSGFLGRDATATDLRAYEELANIAAANGGQLPMDSSSPSGQRVQELMQQLNASPAEEMRRREAERHNATINAMSNFMHLQTQIDKWMTQLYDFIDERIQDIKGFVGNMKENVVDAMEKVREWLEENDLVGTVRSWMEHIAGIVMGFPAKIIDGLGSILGRMFSMIPGLGHAANMLLPGAGLAGNIAGAAGSFLSGLFTGPSHTIGGSDGHHIDSKIQKSVGADRAIELIDQMAQGYAEQGKRIEFSNSAVAGLVWDTSASADQKKEWLNRIDAAHSHSPNPRTWDLDYYVLEEGQDRISAMRGAYGGSEIILPEVPGGNVRYGRAGNYGNFAVIRDADGNEVMRTGHGDNRLPLPENRTFASNIGNGLAAGLTDAANALSGGGNTTQLAADLIKQFEGFHRTPYWDHQQYSWGYGTKAPGATGTISRQQAEQELAEHLAGVNQSIDANVRVPLNPNQRAALTSFIYNVGEGAFENSTLLRRLNQGDYGGAASEFDRWVHASGQRLPGLVQRRDAEEELFRTPYTGDGTNLRSSRGGTTNNINVAVTIPQGQNAELAREAARAGTAAALDEFEQRRHEDANPRNQGNLSPVYG